MPIAPLRHLLRKLSVVLLLLLLGRRAQAGIQHVISISVDGLRGDFIQYFLDTEPANFPNFKRLRDRSAYTYNARTDFSQTITIPDHLSMFTGRPVHTNGGLPLSVTHGMTSDAPAAADTVHVYASASGNNSGPYKASIFDMVHDRGLSTALYLGKTRLQVCERSWNAANGAADITGSDNGKNKLDYVSVVEAQGTNGAATTTFVNDLVARISTGTIKNYTHLHIADVDYAGHASSWSTTVGGTYRAGVITADGWIGQLLNAIDANASLNGKVAVLLTADHGGGTPSNHHTTFDNITNYTIPFFLWAPGITAGSDLYTWFDNRFNPGVSRPTETAAAQPIRNGDIANLAATLVGVPYVTGSSLIPQLKIPLVAERAESAPCTVGWPVYLTGWTLEWCDDLPADPQVWTTVTTGITEANGRRAYVVNDPVPNARFFRLRSPQ
jgi:hypothetical protein